MPELETERYLAVFEPKASVADLETSLKSRGIKIEDRYDFIRTLVLSGNKDAILSLPQTLPAITSVQKEGIVRIPE